LSLPARFCNAPHLRSYVVGEYELRITARCLQEDLDADITAPFARLMGHDIIKGFFGRRRISPEGGEELTDHRTGQRLFKLGYDHAHRGATWFDQENGVVWLLAYGHHRSGAPDDAYRYMEQLGREGRLLPEADDYEALVDDRVDRAAEVVVAQAQELLAAARRLPGTERRGVLGAEAPVGVLVEVVEWEEEICIAFSYDRVPPGWISQLPSWFVSGTQWDQWCR